MKKIIFILTFLLFSLTLVSQTIEISEYIRSTENDYRLKGKKQIADTFRNSSKNTPLLKDIGFRTETDDFDILRQKYALRFYFKGLGETKSGNSVIDGYKDLYDIEYKIDFTDILLERYSVVLLYIESKNNYELLKELRSVYEDRIEVLRKKIAISAEVNLTEIVDTEDKITDIDLEMIKIENQLYTIEETIKEQTDRTGDIGFEKENLISFEKIEEFLKKAEIADSAGNIKFEYRKLRISLAESELDYEIKRTSNFFDYLSLEYDTKDWATPKKSFSVGFGVNIPGIQNKAINISRKKASLINQKLNCEKEQTDFERRIKNNIKSIRRLSKQYSFLAEKFEDDEASLSLKKYISIEGADPLTILKLKESVVKSKMKQLTIKSNVYSRYISLLNLLGILPENPDENHLTGNDAK